MSRDVVRQLAHRRELLTVGAAIAGLLPLSNSGFAAARRSRPNKGNTRTDKTSETAATLRDLWIGHIFWVRAVSLATIEKQGAIAKTAERQAVANAQSIARDHRAILRRSGQGRLLQAPCGTLWCRKSLSCSDGRRRHHQARRGNSVSNFERRGNCKLPEQGKPISAEGCRERPAPGPR